MRRRWPAAIVSLLVLFWDGAAAQAQYYGGYRTATYFEMRRMNASYRAETRRPPPTPEELMSFNQQRTPERLGPDQIDPLSGKLLWPPVLRGAEFAGARAKLERLFAVRAIHSYDCGLGTQNYREILAAADEMHGHLKGRLSDLRPDEYIACQKFLKSLAFEARFSTAAAPEGVGANGGEENPAPAS